MNQNRAFWLVASSMLTVIVVLSIYGRQAVGFKTSGIRSPAQYSYFRSGAKSDKHKRLSFWMEQPQPRK